MDQASRCAVTLSRMNFSIHFYSHLFPPHATHLVLASGRRRVSVSDSWVTTATLALARIGAARRAGTVLSTYGGRASQ